MKVITLYELLGLVKDGKAPKKIKFYGNIYEWEDAWYLTKEKNYKVCLGGKKEDCNILTNAFNKNVEIIEEEKEIEEFDDDAITLGSCRVKINELVREINKLKRNLKND